MIISHENVESIAAEHAGMMAATGRAPSVQRRCATQKLVALRATERQVCQTQRTCTLWGRRARMGHWSLHTLHGSERVQGTCPEACAALLASTGTPRAGDTRSAALNYFGSLRGDPAVKLANNMTMTMSMN